MGASGLFVTRILLPEDLSNFTSELVKQSRTQEMPERPASSSFVIFATCAAFLFPRLAGGLRVLRALTFLFQLCHSLGLKRRRRYFAYSSQFEVPVAGVRESGPESGEA